LLRKLDTSTTSPNVQHWGIRVASPKGLSLSVCAQNINKQAPMPLDKLGIKDLAVGSIPSRLTSQTITLLTKTIKYGKKITEVRFTVRREVNSS